MRNITKILNVPIDALTMQEATEKAVSFLKDGKRHIICTPNPEIVMAAQDDPELMTILQESDLVAPDGIGVVWASRYSKTRIEERVAGYDLTQNIFDKIKDTDYTVFFFGGAEGVPERAKEKMEEKYVGLKIVGARNGYFNANEENNIIQEIKKVSPDILLVGLGAPKQEKWIYKNMDEIGASIYIGVGGSFDVMSGNTKRAPKFFQKLGLEWFYRLVTQPTRLGRMMKLPQFALAVLKDYFKRR